jgi:hypothetical protein
MVNGYAEVEASQQGKTALALYGAPGLTVFARVFGSGGVRSLYTASNGRLFVVCGNGVFELFADGSQLLLGVLTSFAGPVSMRDNGLQMLLVDGVRAYVLTLATNVFSVVPDLDMPVASQLGILDNYFLFDQVGTQQFGWTDLLSVDVDPLSFTSAEGSPDALVSLLVVHRELWCFGVASTEVFFDTGDPDTPFQRNQGVFIHQGSAAPFAPARVGETVCWLARNLEGQGMVMQAQGYTPQRISTHAVEVALERAPTLSDAIGWSQQQGGHLFYWLTLPSGNMTWVYDTTTGLWHERAALDPATGQLGRHRANCYTFAFGKHLVGDYADGRIYSLDQGTYTNAGDPLVFEAVLPPFFDAQGLSRIRHERLQLDCDVGVGLDGGVEPGEDPQIVLRLSNDGGATWPVERPMPLGPLGAVRTQVEWRQLGSAYDRRLAVRITSPVKRVILGAVSDYTVLQA